MEYRLKIDGDSLEKEAWDELIQNYFPNYEIFWKLYVVPKTERPKGIRFKKNLKFNEKRISMLHYSILYHLNYVNKNKHLCNNREIFENCYVHLSSACDLTEELFFRYFVLKGKINLDKVVNSLNEPKKPIKENILKSIDKMINFNIKQITGFEQVINNSKTSKELKKFKSLADKIRQYRNLIVHSWLLFWINGKVPDVKILSDLENRDWGNVFHNLESSENNYVSPIHLVTQNFDKLISKINLIWEILIEVENNENKN